METDQSELGVTSWTNETAAYADGAWLYGVNCQNNFKGFSLVFIFSTTESQHFFFKETLTVTWIDIMSNSLFLATTETKRHNMEACV